MSRNTLEQRGVGVKWKPFFIGWALAAELLHSLAARRLRSGQAFTAGLGASFPAHTKTRHYCFESERY